MGTNVSTRHIRDTDVQEYVPVRLSEHSLQRRQQAAPDLGQEGAQWAHQAHH